MYYLCYNYASLLHSLERILKEILVFRVEHFLKSKGHDRPHIVDGLHSRLATLLQLLFVHGRAACEVADLQDSEGSEHREAEYHHQSELPGGGETNEDSRDDSHNGLD